MPELPEVETIARSLNHAADRVFNHPGSQNYRSGVIGSTIRSCDIQWERTIAKPDAKSFCAQVAGQSIHEVVRRGKFIQFKLNDGFMICHLRMSGDIRVEPDRPDSIQKHDRIVLHFKDGSRLVFNDPRKFGRFWLVDDPQTVFDALGPEPFSSELTPPRLLEMLHRRKRSIKTLLMDQTFLAGLGNIYTDEALHLARIHPLQRSDTLSMEDADQLLKSIREVLRDGIRRNGASIDWVYRGGDFQNHFKVYQRTGKPCLTCGFPIERIVHGQRGTHFCPNCQKKL